MKPPMPLLLRGDARALPLPDDSVDLVVTSPPYFALRSYSDGGQHYDGQIGSEPSPAEFLDELIACTAEMVRVVKPSGSLWVNLGDKYNSAASGQQNGNGHKSGLGGGRHDRMMGRGSVLRTVPNKSLMLLPHRFAIRCVDEIGLVVRQDQVWSKVNGLPESVTDRTRRSHEYFFHLTKSPRYFSAVDDIRQPLAAKSLTHRGGGESWGNERNPDNNWADAKVRRPDPRGVLPGSVWEIASQPLKVPNDLGVDHFAAFPMEWPRRIIKGWSPPGGVVLDPFSGTGTTALVATMLGRRGIGVELSADYNRLAQWRCSDPKERARAAGLDPDAVSKIHAEIPGQGDLFGEAS